MKAIIAYLSRSTDDNIRQMLRSIRLLEKNFLPWSPADIIIFHESGFDKSLIERETGCKTSAGSIRFAQVDFSANHPGLENLAKGQRGYRHMCHFFANDVFSRQELAKYDYYMRLDVDSYLLSKVRYNIFERMSQRGWRYVYRMEMNEREYVANGLLDVTRAFFVANPALNIAKPSIRRVGLYYTNFEICDLAFFRDTPWQRFFAAIDAAGGIWRCRWGDAPIRWLGLKHLLRPCEIYCIRQLSYFHQFRLRSGFACRLPLEYLRYAALVMGIKLHLPVPDGVNGRLC